MRVYQIKTQWNSSLYNNKHAFVFKYGEDLVDILQPKPGEYILDLGCGTGYLTSLIGKSGASVLGIDSSANMIATAKLEYPGINFEVGSATDFITKTPFDAIFSNAVLHWVTDYQAAIDTMYSVLKTGGRLVVEFGGNQNVEGIVNTLRSVLLKYGFDDKADLNPWYFPSLSEYAGLLEQKGFRVLLAAHYDRETELKDNDNGIKDWIKMFGSSFLEGIDEQVTELILNDIQDALSTTHFRDGKWWADYKRLRIVAVKQR